MPAILFYNKKNLTNVRFFLFDFAFLFWIMRSQLLQHLPVFLPYELLAPC